MINVIAPPGCYGTYIARCLHHYSDPAQVPYVMDFDSNGSSHAYRSVKNSTAIKASNAHWDSAFSNLNLDSGNTVIVTAARDNWLDYYNNQYTKQFQYNLTEFIVTMFAKNEINDKLKTHWGYNNEFDSAVPLWIVREFCSFWITETWQDAYDVEKYLALPHAYSFCCDSLWKDNFYELIVKVAQSIGYQIADQKENIENNHREFLKVQKFHNSQHRVTSWVDDVVNGKPTSNPCQTLFDEAYAQHLFRQQAFEIKCAGLDKFPSTSIEMQSLIYKQ